MGRVGFRGKNKALCLSASRSALWRGCRRYDTTPATGMRDFWRISLAIPPSRSRSVRLCYKNARSVTSGHLAGVRRRRDQPADTSEICRERIDFAYFHATRAYLEAWGKPVAFYRSVGCRSKSDYGPKISVAL